MSARRAVSTRLALVLALVALAAGTWIGAVLDQYHFFDPTRDRLSIIATWDWAAIGAVITAVATVVLAYFAIQATLVAGRALAAANVQAESSAEAARAASEAVAAANREADASVAVIDEMRVDRSLQYRPHLMLTVQLVSGANVTLQVRNIGNGPALKCLAAAHRFYQTSGHEWSTSGDFDLAPGDNAQIEVRRVTNETRARILTETPVLMGEGVMFAVAYEDLLGSRYRVRRVENEVETDTWQRIESGTAPEWATWVERR